jgi:hypothetical protein
MFFFNFQSYSDLKTNFDRLTLEIKKLETQIEPKVIQLDRLLEENKHGRMVFDPPYWISKANSNSSGQYYIGKIVIPSYCMFNPQKGKVLYLNFYLGKTDGYKDQMDSELISKAIEKSRSLVEKRIFFGSSKHFAMAKNLYLQEIEEIKKLEIEVANLKKQLDEYQQKFKEISVVVAPNITISETKSKSLGQYYFGKVRIPAHSVYNPNIGKVLYLNFYLGKTNDFEGKTDIKLKAKAELLAESIIRRKLFHENPRIQYPRSMKDYLTEISDRWDFPKPNEVKVKDLLQKFDNLVCLELIQKYGENESKLLIEKFRRGALVIHPKTFTINEANRLPFSKVGGLDNKLFYYPDFPDGNYTCKWMDLRIAPLKHLTEPNNIHTFTNDEGPKLS